MTARTGNHLLLAVIGEDSERWPLGLLDGTPIGGPLKRVATLQQQCAQDDGLEHPCKVPSLFLRLGRCRALSPHGDVDTEVLTVHNCRPDYSHDNRRQPLGRAIGAAQLGSHP